MRGYSKILNRYAVLVVCSTLFLIVVGGLVTSTQSGLSVPDWPNTYGHFMFAFPLDQMVGGILYEHSHRMIASVVGLLTVILAIWLWKKDERSWVRVIGYAAVGLVIAQGVLGGITVLFLLPAWISTLHATLAQTFFVVVTALAVFTSKWWRDEQPRLKSKTNSVGIPKLVILTSITIYIQLIVGALMRHSEAGLAVPDFPLAYSQLFPSLTGESIEQYNQQLETLGLRIFADDQITKSQILIHMAHRIWACVVTYMVIWTAFRIHYHASENKRLSILSKSLFVLIILQVTLGAYTILSQKAIDITTAHVATGAVLLGVSIIALLYSIKLFGFTPKQVTLSVPAKEATP